MDNQAEHSTESVTILVRAIALIAILIAGVQFASSAFGPQSRWKGGGFGMYTEPHPNRRAAWLILTDADGQEYRHRMWQAPDAFRQQAEAMPKTLRAKLKELEILAYRRAVWGDPALDASVLSLANDIHWYPGPENTLRLQGGAPLVASSARIEIFHVAFDVADGVLRAVAE